MAREIVHPVEVDQIRKKAQRLLDDPAHSLGNATLAAVVVRLCDSHEEVRGRCVGLVHAADGATARLAEIAESIVTHDSIYRPLVQRLREAIKKAEEVMCA